MPRAMRWNEIYGTFRSGQLSPAQQDNIRSEVWRNGAALVENFRIERDGGLSPRPNFKRQAVTVDLPTLDLLSAASGGPYHTHNTVSVPIHPRGAEHEYIARVGTGSEEFHQSQANSVIFELDFVRGGNTVHADLDKMRAITFHGVRRIEGHTFYGAGERTLNNFAVWMEWGDTANSQDDANWVQYPEPRPVPDPPWNGTPETGDADLLGLGAFSPGQVARDITIPVPAAARGKFIRKIEIRITRAAPTGIVVEGLSCFGYGEGTPLALERPYRLIPWPIRGQPFVLVVGLSEVKRAQLDPFRQPLDNRVEAWPFTPRQLREMTWCRNGANLLLCHHDFPHPLDVIEGDRSDVIIGSADLRNVPVVTQDMFQVLLPNIVRRGDDVLTSPVRPTGQADVPYSPRILTLVTLTAVSATFYWTFAPGNTYDLEFERWNRTAVPPVWEPLTSLNTSDVEGGEYTVTGLDSSYDLPGSDPGQGRIGDGHGLAMVHLRHGRGAGPGGERHYDEQRRAGRHDRRRVGRGDRRGCLRRLLARYSQGSGVPAVAGHPRHAGGRRGEPEARVPGHGGTQLRLPRRSSCSCQAAGRRHHHPLVGQLSG